MRVFQRDEFRRSCEELETKYTREGFGVYREIRTDIPPAREKLIVEEGWRETIRTLQSTHKLKGDRMVCFWKDDRGNEGCCTVDWWNYWKAINES